jgi:tagatose 1,6-diphosphate aldolase
MLVRELEAGSSAMLLDPHYAFPGASADLARETGLLLTLEDSIFEETPTGRRSFTIPDWSVEKIKRTGADGVKLLAWYRPDADAEIIAHQQRLVGSVGEACARYDLPFVFELLTYPFPGEEEYTGVEPAAIDRRARHVIESVETFADRAFGVDLFKLESPIPPSAVPDPATGRAAEMSRAVGLFRDLAASAGRPWVVLSAGAAPDEFRNVLQHAYTAGASGFLAGRAIWWNACAEHFPDWKAMETGLRSKAAPYLEEVGLLTNARAKPWFAHPRFGEDGAVSDPGGPDFRSRYAGFEPSS